MITAQYDYLTSQAKAYAHYLAAAHVPVTWVNYCGVGTPLWINAACTPRPMTA